VTVAVAVPREHRRRRPAGASAVSGSGSGAGSKPGGASAGQERVAAIQRSRLLAAMVDVAQERGAAGVSVAHVVARAGISRRTFYELFEDREDCFMATFDHALARATDVVLPAYEAQGVWRERVRAGLVALLAFFDEEPGLGAVLVVDALNAGPAVLERRGRLLDTLIGVVDRGRGEGRGQDSPPLAAEGVVGAVFSVIHARMLERRAQGAARPSGRGREPARASRGTRGLLGLTNPLMGMIVAPYMGAAAARRELERPAPRVTRPAVERSHPNPLRDLEMRLTYRTVRALLAIGEHPGASNRQVAEHAGVADQGQISKLLARLEHLGLIENVGAGPAKGEPNAWSLTAKGTEVERAIRSETAATENHEEGTGR
jgi:AcrR family transcriptional regulator/DNA-binding MarR family transcriptional regulator